LSLQTRLPALEAQLMAGKGLRVGKMNQLMLLDRFKALTHLKLVFD